MEPPPGDRWVKKHPNGCISYKDDEGKMQMWRPELGPKGIPSGKEELGHIYVLTCPSFRKSDTYKMGYTKMSKSNVMGSYNTSITSVEILIFISGSKKDADRFLGAFVEYRILRAGNERRSETIIMPLGNLMETVRKIPGIVVRDKVYLDDSDTRQFVSNEDLIRHATVFLKMYKRSEGNVMRRDGMFLSFMEYLKPLSLYTSYALFRSALAKIGYATSGTIVMSVRESIESSIRQTALRQQNGPYIYIVTDVESHYNDRYKIGYFVGSYGGLISRYRSSMLFDPIIIATFPGTLETEGKLLRALSRYTIPHNASKNRSSEVVIMPLGNLIEMIHKVLDVDLTGEVRAGAVKELIVGEELMTLVKQFVPAVSPGEDIVSLYENFIYHLRKVAPLRFATQVNFFNALRNLGHEFRVHKPAATGKRREYATPEPNEP